MKEAMKAPRPLFDAARDGNKDLVESLIANGANVNPEFFVPLVLKQANRLAA
jgi:hypothetical protein